MDTIQITKQSIEALQALKDTIILSDSIKVILTKPINIILPDSIHTFQTKEPGNISQVWKEFFQVFTPSIGVLTSIVALFVSYKGVQTAKLSIEAAKEREREKAKIRIDTVKIHILSWLNIIKINIIKQAKDCSTYGVNKYRMFQLFQMRYYTLPFDKILDLDKIDLSEVLIFNTIDKEKNVFKLHQLSELNNESSLLINDIKKNYDDFHSKIFNTSAQYKQSFEEILKTLEYSKPDKEIFDLLMSQILEMEFKNAPSKQHTIDSITGAIDKVLDNNISTNLKSQLINHRLLLYNLVYFDTEKYECFESYEFSLLQIACKVHLIEEYYRGNINNEEFEIKYKEEYGCGDLYSLIEKK